MASKTFVLPIPLLPTMQLILSLKMNDLSLKFL